jgi:outer membrane receptor protein involved in Fe transport
LPVDLDNVMLLNASLTYNFNTRFSFWLKGDNLLDKTYQRWLNYPSLGVQIIGGVVYSFK